MSKEYQFKNLDRALKGDLSRLIAEQQRAGENWVSIGHVLHGKWGIDVHPDTIKRWWTQVIEPSLPEAAR